MYKFIPNVQKIQSKIVELYWNGKINNIPSINAISQFCVWMGDEIPLQIWCQELCFINLNILEVLNIGNINKHNEKSGNK